MIARLLPDIVGSGDWELKAVIVQRGYDRVSRSLTFELDTRSAYLLGAVGETGKTGYDSTVEERFARSFSVSDTGWTLVREPEPLMAGLFVFIPDFQFMKRGMELYMEVVGFWTEDYLKKKLYKLQQLKEENLIVAVDRKLACSEFKKLKGKVIYFEKEVPVIEVLKYLRGHEEKAHKRELLALSKVDVVLQGDVIQVADLAKQYNVGRKAIVERMEGVEGYVLIGWELISRGKIEWLEKRLSGLPRGAKYAVVEKMLGEEGISSVNSLLGYLGYEVEWLTLNPNEAKVIKRG
jgi:hypothetical protein